jgi:hypothetical protein
MDCILTIDTLGDLDGGMVRAAVNQLLAAAIHDLEDRGHDEKPRKVVIEVSLTKINEEQVGVVVSASARLPKVQPRPTITMLRLQQGKPAITFQSQSPQDPRQPNFPQLDDGPGPA